MIRFPSFEGIRESITKEGMSVADLTAGFGKTRKILGLAVALALGALGGAYAQQDYVPPLSGSVLTYWQVQGEYYGTIDGGGGNLGAWLVANGNDNYTVILLPGGLLTHSGPKAQYGGWSTTGWSRSNFLGTGKLSGTTFTTTTPNGYKTLAITGSGEDRTMTGTTPTGANFTLKRVVRNSPSHLLKPRSTWKTAAPVLWFDSSTAQADLSKWAQKDNAVQLSRKIYLYRGIKTQSTHGAGLLHIEFQGCFNPTATGQARSNSGIYLQSHYEAQVLDSFGTSAAIDDYGAVYSVKPPSVNAALPPLTWHTYDIYFTPRTSGSSGQAQGAATMTVYANSVKTQDNTQVLGVTTAGDGGDLLSPGPLYLQNHGNEVVYNNIWFIPNATPETLPPDSLWADPTTEIRLQPLHQDKSQNILGLEEQFDMNGRKIQREKHYLFVQPLFSLPASKP